MALRYLVTTICFCVITILPLAYAYIQDNSQAFPYNDPEMKGFLSCLQRSRCSQIANTTFEEKVCQCDPECAMFGDCCIDAVQSSSKKTPLQTCVQLGNITDKGLYMINSCPSHYAGPREISRRCLDDDFSDLANSAPVTDFVNRQIYLNRYCVLCNEVPLIFVKPWTISDCRVENPSPAHNLSWTDATYHPTEKKLGYVLDGEFHQCKLVFDKLPSVPTIGRSCKPNVISSCPVTSAESYRKACESYTAVVRDSSNNLYKNPHCAVCNNVASFNIMCLSPSERKQPSPFYQALMNINDVFGFNKTYYRRRRPVPRRCPPGLRYDRFLKKCKQPGCVFTGYSIKDGRCVKN